MSSLKTPLESDQAAAKAWQWLRINVKDALVLSICHAILEADTEALSAITMAHFTRERRLAEACSHDCNLTLSDLKLHGALRTGFSYEKGCGRDYSSLLLVSETNKTVVRVTKHADQEQPEVRGMVEQSVQKVRLVSFAMLKLKEALINGVEKQGSF